MIFVQHPAMRPRLLELRRNNPSDNGTPLIPMNSWSGFGGKEELRNDLSIVQKGLCPYCEIKLDTELGSHIEPIQPFTTNPHLTFEYTNLILSCFNSDALHTHATRARSCGHYKDNARIHGVPFDITQFIGPTESNCESYFHYELNGEININPLYSQDLAILAKVLYTIDRLNLNCNRLVRQREEVINEGFEIIRDLGNDQLALSSFIELEFQIINRQYLFPFINLRKQFFRWYKV